MPKISTPAADFEIVEFEVIDSTNSEAHRRAAAGERGPLWIRADRQQAGRGRSGRPWSSPAGNFSATYLFSPAAVEPGHYHHLSFIAGVAAWDALGETCAGKRALQLKWPNDLMVGDAKLGGILVESSRYDGDDVILVGIGINLAARPEVADRTVTHLAAHGVEVAPRDLLHHIAGALSRWLAVWSGGRGFPAVREAWMARAHAVGSRLTVKGRETTFSGTYEGLGPDGSLELCSETGERLSVTHGDVSLVRTVDD